jgi:hypothetical protein
VEIADGYACSRRDPRDRRLVEAEVAGLGEGGGEDARTRVARLGVGGAPGGRLGSFQGGVPGHG